MTSPLTRTCFPGMYWVLPWECSRPKGVIIWSAIDRWSDCIRQDRDYHHLGTLSTIPQHFTHTQWNPVIHCCLPMAICTAGSIDAKDIDFAQPIWRKVNLLLKTLKMLMYIFKKKFSEWLWITNFGRDRVQTTALLRPVKTVPLRSCTLIHSVTVTLLFLAYCRSCIKKVQF